MDVISASIVDHDVICAEVTEILSMIDVDVLEITSTREKKHYWANPYSYCCIAPLGAAETDDVWTISRIKLIDDGVEVMHAYGVKASDYLSVNYS